MPSLWRRWGKAAYTVNCSTLSRGKIYLFFHSFHLTIHRKICYAACAIIGFPSGGRRCLPVEQRMHCSNSELTNWTQHPHTQLHVTIGAGMILSIEKPAYWRVVKLTVVPLNENFKVFHFTLHKPYSVFA